MKTKSKQPIAQTYAFYKFLNWREKSELFHANFAHAVFGVCN